MASDNKLVDDGEGVVDEGQSCTGSEGLDSQSMSRQTHVHQDQPPSPAKPDTSRNDHISGCHSRILNCSINPRNIPTAPLPTQGNAGLFKGIAWKREGGLLVLLPTLIQWAGLAL